MTRRLPAILRRRAGVLQRRLKQAGNPDSFSRADLAGEVLTGLDAHPGRLMMTTVGVIIGVASLVVTIGLAQTSARHLSRQFDSAAATHAVAQATGSQQDGPLDAVLPWSAAERVAGLSGVEAAVLLADVDTPEGSVTTVVINDPSQPTGFTPTITAAGPELLEALGGRISDGRMFDLGHDARHDRVVVLGAGAAERLNVTRIDSQPSVFVRGTAFAVIGILESVDARTNLLNNAIVPLGTARELFGLEAPTTLDLRITPGAGSIVAGQVPIALDPNTPARFSVVAPPPPSQLRKAVAADVDLVFLILGLLALLGGGVGIANVTQSTIAERTGEIGLRRALGATDSDIRWQFVLEPSVTGLLGGLIGASLGTAAVTVMSLAQGWTPVIDLLTAVGCAASGAIVGILAGLHPSRRAAQVEPAEALHGGI